MGVGSMGGEGKDEGERVGRGDTGRKKGTQFEMESDGVGREGRREIERKRGMRKSWV